MPINPRRLSPALPGAWASSWTLSPAYESDGDGDEQTPQKSRPLITDHTTHNGRIFYPSISRTPNPEESKRTSHRDSAYSHGQASRCSSYDDDLSDDFYSIISQEDTTFIPVILNESSEVDKQIAVKDLVPLDLSEPLQESPELSSRLHPVSSQEDLTFSEVISPKASPTHSIHSCGVTPGPATVRNGVFLGISSGSRLSSSSTGDTVTSVSSNRSSLSGESCSGRSMVFRKNDLDQESTQSNYLGLNYAHVCNLIAQLADGAASEASLPATQHQRFPRHQNSRQIRRRRIDRECNENQNNELEFSQPDGNAPWTLSLDPTLTATESTTSHSSISSSSTHSYGSQDEELSRRYPPFPSSSQSNSFLRNNSFTFSRGNGTYDTETSIARLESDNSVYAQPTSGNDSIPMTPLYPPVREEASRPKKVMQKTKDFCNKFKRFIIPKKVLKQKDAPRVSERPVISESVYPELPPPIQSTIQSTSPPDSPRTWSFVRRRGFQRSLRTSLPSSQYSPYRQGAMTQNSTASIDKRSYEYHARPKTLEEVRSKRRFSLPAFSGTTPNQRSKSAGQPSTSNSIYHRRPRNGSIMTSASQNNSFLMNTLT